MVQRFRAWLAEWALYLPAVRAEMAVLPTQAERDRARWHVWRKLFKTWQYWLLCALIAPVLILAMIVPLVLVPQLWHAFLNPWATAERLGLMVYYVAMSVVLSVLGLWPLQRMIQRRLREYLNANGLNVCLHCGYDLRGSVSAQCAECGRTRECGDSG